MVFQQLLSKRLVVPHAVCYMVMYRVHKFLSMV